MTKDEKYIQGSEVENQFAALGYLAMYGGRKGHGFWITKSTVADVAAYNAAWERARQTQQLSDGAEIPAGETMKNDGKRSGNDCFWMMRDALDLLAKIQQEAA